ncbi:hypothetical protein [Chondromyces apiculatus]|uniref:Uncharacterized protein n=1 Tax=Chondromyces apiculatus DSM 436 TaxID=1192034 RepID=A0A017TI11_9BACT|nr:hypothetical protein [Chondromyces apiculatus]EYF08512.1 Hypothetical protein CAP_4042 [Chondromyces apiculatus DSM 436]
METTKSELSQRIRAAIEPVCIALDAAPAEALHAIAARDAIMTGLRVNPATLAFDRVELAEVYPDAVHLAEGLARRDAEVLGAALPLLVAREARAAIPHFLRLLDEDYRAFGPQDVETWIYWSLGAVYPAMIALLPVDTRVDLWLRGKADGHAHVPLAARAAVPWERLRAALRAGLVTWDGRGSEGLDEVLRARSDFATPEARMARLAELALTAEGGEREVVTWLVRTLATDRATSAAPLLLSMRGGDLRPLVEEALLSLGTREALDPIAADLDKSARKASLRWDAHHVAPEIKTPIEAMYRLDPTAASARFARYFTDEAVATETGAKLAHDIWAVGTGTLIAHGDYIARTESGSLLRSDPGWLPIAARLVKHPRLGTFARTVLSQGDRQARDAALHAAGNPLAKPAPPAPWAPATPPRWLDRYRAGEHEAVWRELAELPGPPAGALADEATEVARETMARARKNLTRIVARFRTLEGAGVTKKALLAPDPARAASYEAITRVIGGPLPASLRAFYDHTGAVNLASLAWWWNGPAWEVTDPLVIHPVRTAAQRTRAHRASTNRGLPRDLQESDGEIVIGPDPATKFDPDQQEPDESPFLLVPTAGGVEGIVRQGDAFALPFVDYLRQSMSMGGLLPKTEGRPTANFHGSALDLLHYEALAGSLEMVKRDLEPF